MRTALVLAALLLTAGCSDADQRIADAAELCGLDVNGDGEVLADYGGGDAVCVMRALDVSEGEQAIIRGHLDSGDAETTEVDGITYTPASGLLGSVVLVVAPS